MKKSKSLVTSIVVLIGSVCGAIYAIHRIIGTALPTIHGALFSSSKLAESDLYLLIVLGGCVVFNFLYNKAANKENTIQLKDEIKGLHKEIKESKQSTIEECTKLIDERVNSIKIELKHNTKALEKLDEKVDKLIDMHMKEKS